MQARALRYAYEQKKQGAHPLTLLKSPESRSKSTEAIAEVDLDLDEGDFETNTMG